MIRLSSASFPSLPSTVRRPAYERGALENGIVHLGPGAFARAHLADYTDDALEQECGPWGITGISLQTADMRDRLGAQDGLYSLMLKQPGDISCRVIGSVKGVIAAREDVTAAIAAIARPQTKIVTLTITEKGYCHDPASGALNLAHPAIAHDLKKPDAPESAIGLIVAGLAARRADGAGPLTVMSLDNLPSNGKLLKRLVLDFAERRDAALALWIGTGCAFPCSMVDRIVPAASGDDLAAASAALGFADAAPVTAEPFRQWVIEDQFAAGRPAWHLAGAELVSDVAPHEFMKLRLLNGAHSALAYLGYLAGHETVADASADPVFEAYLKGLWREILPAVPPPQGVNLEAYTSRLLQRFKNPAIRHRTWQIAMDGSQKLPQRLLGTIHERFQSGGSIDHLLLAAAAWMRYAAGRGEQGQAIDVRDPYAAEFRRIGEAAGGDAAALARGFLAFRPVFGDGAEAAALAPRMAAMLRLLLERGAKGAISSLQR